MTKKEAVKKEAKRLNRSGKTFESKKELYDEIEKSLEDPPSRSYLTQIAREEIDESIIKESKDKYVNGKPVARCVGKTTMKIGGPYNNFSWRKYKIPTVTKKLRRKGGRSAKGTRYLKVAPSGRPRVIAESGGRKVFDFRIGSPGDSRKDALRKLGYVPK